MINPFHDVDWCPDLVQRRSFAKSLIIGFPCLALAFLLVGWAVGSGWNVPRSAMIAGVGFAVGVLFYFVPAIVKPFYIAWYFLACCIGMIVGNLLLAIVYYTVVTGTGLALRACGRRKIQKSSDLSADTYWRDAEPMPKPRQYFRQY